MEILSIIFDIVEIAVLAVAVAIYFRSRKK